MCLTEEPTEILCALDERDRIVGISAYTVRPEDIRRDKPVVSAFLDGSVSKISALNPDLVVGFSDIQAELAAKLIKAHLNNNSTKEIDTSRDSAILTPASEELSVDPTSLSSRCDSWAESGLEHVSSGRDAEGGE